MTACFVLLPLLSRLPAAEKKAYFGTVKRWGRGRPELIRLPLDGAHMAPFSGMLAPVASSRRAFGSLSRWLQMRCPPGKEKKKKITHLEETWEELRPMGLLVCYW